MTEIEGLITLLREFRDERDWAQYHNTKDLALGLSIEAAELLEVFLWKGAEDAELSRIEEELADVLIYALYLVEKHGLDVEDIVRKKIENNRLRYPVSRARGNADKMP